jgi:tRNA A37 threonylcarbamoyladenosine modification protein TsaB
MRIGAAIAQALRYTNGTPVLSLSMLDILAWGVPLDGPASLGALTTPVIEDAERPEGETGSGSPETQTNLKTPSIHGPRTVDVTFAPAAYIAPILDARQNEFYAALYRRGDKHWHAVLPPGRFTAADLAPRLPYNTVVFGNGAGLWRKAAAASADTEAGEIAVVEGHATWGEPTIAAMVALAQRLTALGVKPDITHSSTSPVMPMYLRPPSVTLADGVHEVAPGSPPVKDDPIQ